MRSQSSSLVMSPAIVDASPPSDSIIRSVSLARSSIWSTSSTLAPSRAIRIAAAFPFPIPSPLDPAPVMIATLPSSLGARSAISPQLSCRNSHYDHAAAIRRRASRYNRGYGGALSRVGLRSVFS